MYSAGASAALQSRLCSPIVKPCFCPDSCSSSSSPSSFIMKISAVTEPSLGTLPTCFRGSPQSRRKPELCRTSDPTRRAASSRLRRRQSLEAVWIRRLCHLSSASEVAAASWPSSFDRNSPLSASRNVRREKSWSSSVKVQAQQSNSVQELATERRSNESSSDEDAIASVLSAQGKLRTELDFVDRNGSLNISDEDEESCAEKEAWALLRSSIVSYCGCPVGTIAAQDPTSTVALNYDQVFIRDFIPSAIAFLLKGESEIVKEFLLNTLRLQVRS